MQNPPGVNRRAAFLQLELRGGSVANVDPIIPVPNNAGIRVLRRVVRIAVVAQAQSETCERHTPAPAAPAPTKATTTEAGHANASADHWAAEARAGDTYATEATSNRTSSEAADCSTS